MNWPGLLKWSIALQNNEQSDIQPMDEERKKWLSEALDSFAVDDVEIMKDILQNLQKKELNTKEDEEFRLQQLENLQDILDQIDKAKVLVNLKGMELIIDIMFNSSYQSNKIAANMIFAGCNQNNAQIQQYSLNINSLQIINYFLNEKNIKIKEFLFSSLSSLIRGEHLEVKRIFISVDGLLLIKEILIEENKEKYSDKLRQKALLLLKDMIIYDIKLDQTYSDIEPFANTNQQQIFQQKPNSLLIDEEAKKNFFNFKEENKKFKNYVKGFIKKENFLQIFMKLLENQNQYFIEGRESILSMLIEMIKLKYLVIEQSQKEFLTNHLNFIKNQNAQSDGLYENEISLVEQLVK